MQLMTLLKQQFPNFPTILQSENQTFQDFCYQIIQSGTILQRIPKAFKSAQDIISIQEAQLFKTFFPLIPSQQSFNFYGLLQHDACQNDLNNEILISQFWTHYIETEIPDEFAEESLYSFYRLKALFYHPAQISGLMIALLKKNLPPIRFIETHLFKHFFDQYACDISKIQNACAILKARENEHRGIQEVLKLFQQYSCGLLHSPNMSLDAQLQNTPLFTLPELQAPKPGFSSRSFFLHLFRLFENDLLINIILLEDRDALYLDFQNWFPQQSDECIKNIYHAFLLFIPSDDHLSTFSRLLNITPKSMIPELYETEKDLFWILIALKPELLKKTKKQIIEDAKKHPVTIKNQLFVAQVCKIPKFESMKDKLYFKLFRLQFQMEDSHASVINDLYHHAHTKKWCLDYDNNLLQELNLVIKNGCEHFDINQWIKINDYYNHKRKHLNVLSELGYQNFQYPRDCYHFSVLVLSFLFYNHTEKNILLWLDVLSYFYKNNPQFHREHQHKILRTCLDTSGQMDMKIFICLHLIQHFQYDINAIKNLSEEKSFQLMEAPYQNPFALSCFLQLFKEEEKKLKVLGLKIKKHVPTITEFSLKNPDFLVAILETLSPDNIIIWLTHTFIQESMLWFHLPHEYGYAIVQKKCSLEQRQFLWNQKTRNGESIFEYLMHQPKAIEVILNDISEHDESFWRYLDVPESHPLFFKALKYPPTFNLLFDAIIVDPIKLILSKYNEQYFIEYIIPVPEIFMHALTKIEKKDLAFILEIYGNPMIVYYTHQAKMLKFIFKYMSSYMLLNLLLSPLSTNIRVIDSLIHTKDVLIEIFIHLQHAHRQQLLFSNEKLLLNQLSKTHNQELIRCFEYFSSPELLKLLDSDAFFQMILSDEKALYSYLENLQVKDIKVFLTHQNANGKNWVHAVPLHHQTLDIILSSSPHPLQLINHALICKIINQPECLKVILNYINHEDRGEWILSLQQIYLQNLINSESLIYLFSQTPPNHQMDLLLIKHQRYHSIYQWLLHEFSTLMKVIPYLSEESISLLNHKIILNKQELQTFEKNPNQIKSLFEYFHPEQKFQFLLALCQEYSDKPIVPAIKLEIMKFAISSLEHIESLSPKQFTPEQKNNPMWYKIKHARLFQECIIPLMTRGQTLDLYQQHNIPHPGIMK